MNDYTWIKAVIDAGLFTTGLALLLITTMTAAYTSKDDLDVRQEKRWRNKWATIMLISSLLLGAFASAIILHIKAGSGSSYMLLAYPISFLLIVGVPLWLLFRFRAEEQINDPDPASKHILRRHLVDYTSTTIFSVRMWFAGVFMTLSYAKMVWEYA